MGVLGRRHSFIPWSLDCLRIALGCVNREGPPVTIPVWWYENLVTAVLVPIKMGPLFHTWENDLHGSKGCSCPVQATELAAMKFFKNKAQSHPSGDKAGWGDGAEPIRLDLILSIAAASSHPSSSEFLTFLESWFFTWKWGLSSLISGLFGGLKVTEDETWQTVA